jgi:hypothetical protein
MKARNRNAQYRIVDGQREHLCVPCNRWLAHDRAHFYAHPGAKFGLTTDCIDCMRSRNRERSRSITRAEQRQRQFARAAFAGKLAA